MINIIEQDTLQNKINLLENEYRGLRKQLIELKKSRGPVQLKNYELKTADGQTIELKSLFNDKDEIMIIHNMGKACRYCTLWADGFNGFLQHIENKIPVYLVTPDEPEMQTEFKNSRGWNFIMISTAGTSFKSDMGFEPAPGDYQPGISILKLIDGKIYETVQDRFGPGDDYCSIWQLFGLLEKGNNNWEPKYVYK